MKRRLLLASFVAFIAACSSKPSGTVQLVVGADGNPLAMAPVPTTIDVVTIDTAGTESLIAHGAVGSTSLDLGDHDVSQVAAVRVTASDDAGNKLVWGESVYFEVGALDGATLPLFIQRTGGFAQLPSPLSDAREAPLVTVAADRYVIVAGGNDASLTAQTQIYDLLSWIPLTSPPLLSRAPKSLAMAGLVALSIDDAGADWYDLTASTSAAATAPAGGSFAEIAGGTTLIDSDGGAYVVGATRSAGDPTARILHVSPEGVLAFLSLVTPRLGASATLTGRGALIVAGGSATGAGVEILASGAAAAAIPYPSDPVRGAAIVPLASGHVVLAGGLTATGASAPTREIDPSCTASCAPAVWASAPSTPLAFAQAFALDATTFLLTGEDATGATHAARFSPTLATDVPLKIARKHGRGIALPNGAVLIAGGTGTLESFAR